MSFVSTKATIDVITSNKPYMEMADAIAELFVQKFKPEVDENGKVSCALSEEEFHERSEMLKDKISAFQAEAPRTALHYLLEAVGKTLRTNLYNPNRYALSVRIDPTLLVSGDKDVPFGVFFSHGRYFNGFHNRFRDIARGGLRIVCPQNVDQHHAESSRIYDEVYGLSFAQQLKNKDIPEGGAKAVILGYSFNASSNSDIQLQL
jgi:glutamate dehydrogenase